MKCPVESFLRLGCCGGHLPAHRRRRNVTSQLMDGGGSGSSCGFETCNSFKSEARTKEKKKKRAEIVATGYDRYKKNTMRYSFVSVGYNILYSRQNKTITENNNHF